MLITPEEVEDILRCLLVEKGLSLMIWYWPGGYGKIVDRTCLHESLSVANAREAYLANYLLNHDLMKSYQEEMVLHRLVRIELPKIEENALVETWISARRDYFDSESREVLEFPEVYDLFGIVTKPFRKIALKPVRYAVSLQYAEAMQVVKGVWFTQGARDWYKKGGKLRSMLRAGPFYVVNGS
jgi:hypothetical protein